MFYFTLNLCEKLCVFFKLMMTIKWKLINEINLQYYFFPTKKIQILIAYIDNECVSVPPLLYVFFCCDMFSGCAGKPFKYADDATLVTAPETKPWNSKSGNARGLHQKWPMAEERHSKVSSSKVVFLLLEPRKIDYLMKNLNSQGYDIRRTNSSKTLGLIFDEKLKFCT